jgi:hypothetical protein
VDHVPVAGEHAQLALEFLARLLSRVLLLFLGGFLGGREIGLFRFPGGFPGGREIGGVLAGSGAEDGRLRTGIVQRFASGGRVVSRVRGAGLAGLLAVVAHVIDLPGFRIGSCRAGRRGIQLGLGHDCSLFPLVPAGSRPGRRARSRAPLVR